MVLRNGHLQYGAQLLLQLQIMKDSKLIALSAIATAMAVVALIAGAYVPVLEYSALFIASLCSMLPLAKKSVKGAILSFAATSLLAAFTAIAQPAMIIFYVVFFGLHPTVNYIMREKNFNKVLGVLIKAAWFVGAVLLIYFTFGEFCTEGTFLEREEVKKYVLLILTVGSALLFIVYDLLMNRFQKFVDITVARLKF